MRHRQLSVVSCSFSVRSVKTGYRRFREVEQNRALLLIGQISDLIFSYTKLAGDIKGSGIKSGS
uniref:Uncharacterized protein n=1 Tax=Anguilla anguilla TaxID=7936 RepID=A0A0E9W086_ANGAN